MEPIKVYREGRLDRIQWITDRAKVVLAEQLVHLESASQSIFVDHHLPR